jgi:hypothetical protein
MSALRRTWAWWAAGLCFATYPALRPYADETGAAGLAAMGSGRWLVAHLLGMLAFALLPVGLTAVMAVGTTLRPRLLAAARALAYAGAVGVLPYYGGEAFGLHAIGAYATTTHDAALVTVVAAFRYGPAAISLFGLGLLALAAAGVLVAIAAWGSGPRWRVAGTVLAVGLLAYLPQFFGSPAVRVAHGVLLALGCWAVAALLARAQGSSTSLPRTWPERLVA